MEERRQEDRRRRDVTGREYEITEGRKGKRMGGSTEGRKEGRNIGWK